MRTDSAKKCIAVDLSIDVNPWRFGCWGGSVDLFDAKQSQGIFRVFVRITLADKTRWID
ncbi:MAG: hypothetical protein FWD57_13035 [Polyangiaceae bacterium]|nr:hypothetical protein [Polyangiaceae bacterium]